MLSKVKKILLKKKNKYVFKENNLDIIKSNIFKQASLAIVTIFVGAILAVSVAMAWYSNIAETSDLIFEVSSWGFDGNIEVMEEATIDVSPGSQGEIYFTAENDNDSMVALTVNISKDMMDEEMQKRLYFYVDTTYTQNDETVENVYITGNSGYIYNIFDNDTLLLTETKKNDNSINWEYVYDVLGYYVQGTITESSVEIENYLKPVEYDFDEAIFDEETGSLLKTDENTDLATFLLNLTQNDGYEGTIDEFKIVNGYYQIDIDENGYGVWLYICDLEEIKSSWEYDTAVAENAKLENPSDQYPTVSIAQINVTAQQVNLDGYEVDSATMLRLGLAGDNDVITLTSDITLEETLTIVENQSVIIDLNGNEIIGSSDLSGAVIYVSEGADLTIINGSISTESQANSGTYAMAIIGADVTINNLIIEDVYDAIFIADNQGYTSKDSNIKIKNSTITAYDIGIISYGNGLASGDLTSLIIENSTVVGETYAGILCNGTVDTGTTNGYWGTDIEIINCDISGYWTAIYHPQKYSVLDIYNSVLTGYTGIAIKGGEVSITDSEIYGTGAKATASFSSSGWTDTGDAVYVENGYGWDIMVNIYGDDNIIKSTYGYAVQLFNKDSSYKEYASINLYGGTYSSDVSEFLTD